jgi:replicative DNA helicase
MVVVAKTGSGKSIWLLNMFERICTVQPDKKILFVSLEQTRGEWWERARRIYRFFHPGATDADAANFWRPRLFIDDRNRVNEDQLLGLIEDFKYETGQKPDLIGVDYLGYWARSFKGMPYERTSDAIMSLKAIAKDQRIPIIVPHQVSRMVMHGTEPALDSLRDSGVTEETADFVFVLWGEDTMSGKSIEDRTGELHLKILKSRHGGSGHRDSFAFAPLSLAIVPSLDSRAVFARNELYYQSVYMASWEQAQMRHEAGTPKDLVDFVAVERALNRKRQGHLRVVG